MESALSAAVVLLVALVQAIAANSDLYYIGVGRADVTGPAAEVEMVGECS